MATYGDERYQQEAQACLAPGQEHFCTCRDRACPVNPNNPKNREHGLGCDACIRKNLALGEAPSCIFNKVAEVGEWDDFSIAGFVRFYQERAQP